MMSEIFFTSDLHFCHDREFIYKSRGFLSIQEMNETIVENWNKTVHRDDTVYVLGDLMLNNNDEGLRLIKNLNGRLHIVAGNHDSVERMKLYTELDNVDEVSYASLLNYGGYHFFMSHYPAITGSLEKDSPKKTTLNLYGHTHQKTNFYYGLPFCYHVGVDSHECTPVNIADVILDIEHECKVYRNML